MANGRKTANIFTGSGNGPILRSQPWAEPLPMQRLGSQHLPLISVSERDFAPLYKELERGVFMKVSHQSIHIQTQEHMQFVDLTDIISELIRKPPIHTGFVNVQTKHTTTAIIVNENEPLLLEDMKRTLERIAPQ